MKMIFKTNKIKRSVTLTKEAQDGIISYCKMNHPDEMVLILKGKSKKGIVLVEGLVIPPFSETGPTFAGFPCSFLPLDLIYIGMAHSHPEGSAEPSLEDLNNFVLQSMIYNNKPILANPAKAQSAFYVQKAYINFLYSIS